MRRRIARFMVWWSSSADRKSTRLNSSHSQISYAVFCLKKKKQTRLSMLGTHTLNKPPHYAVRPYSTACHDVKVTLTLLPYSTRPLMTCLTYTRLHVVV